MKSAKFVLHLQGPTHGLAPHGRKEQLPHALPHVAGQGLVPGLGLVMAMIQLATAETPKR